MVLVNLHDPEKTHLTNIFSSILLIDVSDGQGVDTIVLVNAEARICCYNKMTCRQHIVAASPNYVTVSWNNQY